jgi:hypothetical protein
MTTLEFLRTHRTVVERIRRVWPSEREFRVEAVLEAAVAVESFTAKERVDICFEYSAGSAASPDRGPLRAVC